jgi:hypothetical protein
MNRFLFFVATLFLTNCNTNAPDRTYQFLKDLSTDVNKSCPLRVDSIIKLENTVAIPSSTFRYNYTLDYDTAKYDIHEFEKSMRLTTLNSIRTSPDAKTLKDIFATIECNYSDTLGNFLFRIVIKPEITWIRNEKNSS